MKWVFLRLVWYLVIITYIGSSEAHFGGLPPLPQLPQMPVLNAALQHLNNLLHPPQQPQQPFPYGPQGNNFPQPYFPQTPVNGYYAPPHMPHQGYYPPTGNNFAPLRPGQAYYPQPQMPPGNGYYQPPMPGSGPPFIGQQAPFYAPTQANNGFPHRRRFPNHPHPFRRYPHGIPVELSDMNSNDYTDNNYNYGGENGNSEVILEQIPTKTPIDTTQTTPAPAKNQRLINVGAVIYPDSTRYIAIPYTGPAHLFDPRRRR